MGEDLEEPLKEVAIQLKGLPLGLEGKQDLSKIRHNLLNISSGRTAHSAALHTAPIWLSPGWTTSPT